MNRLWIKIVLVAATMARSVLAVAARARLRHQASAEQSSQGGRRRFLIAGSRAAASVTLLAGLPGLRTAAAGAQAVQAPRGGAVALAFDPTSQTLFKASADALYRSGDGGRHWTPIELPPALASRRITSIAVSAGGNGAIYVAGPGIGVLRSADGGRNWSARNEGLPGTDVAALATHADRPETVYVYVSGSGIFRSEDGGQRWRLMDAGPRGGITRFVHSNMPGSMQSGWLFAGGPQGVRRAMDCFCGWRDAGELGRAVRAVAYDPRQPRNVYATTDAGLFVSTDGGDKWSRLHTPTGTIEALIVTRGGTLYAAGADGNLYRRNGAASRWERMDA
ncbi:MULTISPECIES: YCF48-related protein [Cupriavidus]